MPTWSKEGTQFACSRYEGGSGVWIMNLDGTAEKRIDDGWGAQWSPDGKSIAYTNDNNLRVYDVATGKVRTVLGKGEHPYDYLYWNMCWSPDSEQVVFRGKLSDREEIALVQTSGPPKLVRRLQGNKNEFGNDFAWSSDGRRILLNFHANHRRQICQISPGGQDPPKIVPEASFITDARTVCLSPSGQWMVIASAKEGR
jgi:WD40 repeat protein